MNDTYAAQIVDGLVAQVIVGTAQWAEENIDGVWVDTDIIVGIGWSWDETDGFQASS